MASYAKNIPRMHHFIFILFVSLVRRDNISASAAQDVLYPFGPTLDKLNPKLDDGVSRLLPIPKRLPLFGKTYSAMFVVNNGLLTFTAPLPQFLPKPFPLNNGIPMLAPFWADVDNTRSGNIYYRDTTDAVLLARASADIRAYFQQRTFTARWVFVATWDRVPYSGYTSNKVNTFQAALVTDWSETFVLFNYGTIQWTTGFTSGGKPSTGLGGIPAVAGLSSGYSIGSYTIPNSQTPKILNISSTSNVNINGRWAFRVDKKYIQGPGGIIGK